MIKFKGEKLKKTIAQGNIQQCFIELQKNHFEDEKINGLFKKFILNEQKIEKDEAYFNIWNSISSSLLVLIGEYEQEELSGLQKIKSKYISNIDNDLSIGYARLGELHERNVSLSFVKWLRKNHNSLLIEILEAEIRKHTINPVSSFSAINIDSFLSIEKIDVSKEQFLLNLKGYLHDQKGFFNTSLSELNKQEKEKRTLEEAISNALDKRKKLSAGNVVSAVIGGFIYSLFQNVLGPLIENIDEEDLEDE